MPLLAELNRQLIEDERAANPMSLVELEARMRGWLASGHKAVLFEISEQPVAYAVYRLSDAGVYLRQFFVVRQHRRAGVGRRAIELFRDQCVPKDLILSLEVLIHNTAGQAFWRALGFREHALSFVWSQ